ncbi:twin-arginine translocase TatA/TatE family subunit [Halobaculum lipolyticum]|uniref:Sec-independent protein translocase protein TatA n=1 Tax=Halobaculum lipolyticum TaxID=3032001 RepID=A0ABD5WD97_9EURY|nr:twin-arginine translocase TatA/TatE family subunit [Halobaculum sp. DT31]
MTLLFGMLPGGPEMLVILLIVVLLFGANKLPQLARSSGQAMGEFKKGREEIEHELREAAADADADAAVEESKASA